MKNTESIGSILVSFVIMTAAWYFQVKGVQYAWTHIVPRYLEIKQQLGFLSAMCCAIVLNFFVGPKLYESVKQTNLTKSLMLAETIGLGWLFMWWMS